MPSRVTLTHAEREALRAEREALAAGPLRFRFEPLRAAQMLRAVHRRARGVFDVGGFLSLLYLADRRSLVETGAPVTGAPFAWGPEGPTLDLDPQSFAPYFAVEADPAALRVFLFAAEPGDGELSDYDVTTARAVAKGPGLSRKALRRALAALPEGPAAFAGPAPYEAVLAAAGVTEEMIRAYRSINGATRVAGPPRFVR